MYIMDPFLKKKELAHVLEKFGNNPKIIQTKLKKIEHFYSEMKIQFRDFEGVEKLKLSEDHKVKDLVPEHWRLYHFSIEYLIDTNVAYNKRIYLTLA